MYVVWKHTVMHTNITQTLRTHFGFAAFRPGQHTAIQHLLNERHTLVVMPTGAGKSLIYQLAALHRPGLTLVISPLIALMQDQVQHLARYDLPATCINSTLPADEQICRLRAMADGAFKLVYVAPERLRSRSFQQALRHCSIGLLAVDEAHCVSAWGHDFRPDYLHIATARVAMGEPLTVALTATATTRVQQDIIQLLALPETETECVITGFNRPNLTFEVRSTPDLEAKLRALYELLDNLIDGAAIVYVGTRREAEEIAEFIGSISELPTAYYHAGLPADQRAQVQERFSTGAISIVVATNAFGMGIDRPDVRLVVHFSLPGTLEAYYQEAGRAGRDGAAARAVLLYAPHDRALQEWFIEHATPGDGELYNVYNALRTQKQSQVWITSDELSLLTGLPEVKLRLALAHLEQVGSITRIGDQGTCMLFELHAWNPSAVRQVAATVGQHQQRRRTQLDQMLTYAESNACRRRLLLHHFSDHGPATAPRCCDNCLTQRDDQPQNDIASLSQAERVALIILDTLRRLKWEIGREKLAQILKGSRAKDIANRAYQQHIYYGRLEVFALHEIEALIGQLLEQGYLKAVGGLRPVLRLTPQGHAALKRRTPIALQLPRLIQAAEIDRKKAERAAGGTVELTAQMLAQALTPGQIAQRRGLSEETVYSHLARLLAEGRIALADVLPEAIIMQIRSAILMTNNGAALAPIKLRLPDTISYGQIRCVLADMHRARQPACASATPAAAPATERVQRVVELGNMRNPIAIPELVAALDDADGNVRRLAASALGKIGADCAVDPLVDRLAHETKPQVRQYIVKALGRIGDPNTIALLETIAADESERDYTRTSARTALQQIQRPVPDPVTAFLTRTHPRSLPGSWQAGWSLGFHSQFSGASWHRTAVGTLAHRLKYQQDQSALPPLLEQILDLCRAHPELLDDLDALVPVPPSVTRLINPLELLAEQLGLALHKPIWPILTKTRQTAPQKDMHTLAQKRANVAGAFAVRYPVAGRRLLILDDLFDSGATLEEISRVLRQAGAIRLAVLTLTRTIHTDA